MRSALSAIVALASYAAAFAAAPIANAEEPSHPLGAAFLDDRAIRAALLDEGSALVEAGQTLPLETVQEQLKRKRSVLPAPAPENPFVPAPGDLAANLEAASLIVARVRYCCDGCGEYESNAASGFVISPDGLAVTNYHVLDADADEEEQRSGYIVVTRSGLTLPIAEVLAADEAADVALVRLDVGEGRSLPFLPLASAGRVGENVHCISNPAGRFFSYSRGVVTRRHLIRRSSGRTPRLTVTAEYARGSSGAPMINDRGEVIGLVTTTDSVYYTERRGQQRDLQMVFRDCVPVESLRALFAPAPTDEGETLSADTAEPTDAV
ncbi:hypothetical protein LzC2_27170 [Planctomycetes bacterium LzC2]|uniref:Serine protease n=2 Tax=Alienimonas chondri TaxID=2681879 RepID=A0ABX1VFM1_9PLAN|nr:hypothetical protein [Alienimonas chondri]